MYQNCNIYSSVSFTLLFASNPCPLKSKKKLILISKGQAASFNTCYKIHFKPHQYRLFQRPTKNHPCEGDTQIMGINLSQLWLSRAVHTNSCSSPALCLLSAPPRNLQDDQVPAWQGSVARGFKDRKTCKETNPYSHRSSTIKTNKIK